jgi:hypothetical protein
MSVPYDHAALEVSENSQPRDLHSFVSPTAFDFDAPDPRRDVTCKDKERRGDGRGRLVGAAGAAGAAGRATRVGGQTQRPASDQSHCAPPSDHARGGALSRSASTYLRQTFGTSHGKRLERLLVKYLGA